MIKIVIFDIDGVITDGTVYVNHLGEESKRLNFKDIDAIFELKRHNYKIAAITGEARQIVEYFKNRFEWDYFFCGIKDKVEKIKEIETAEGISPAEICYIGDARNDIAPMSYVGLAVCPNDAISDVRKLADIVLKGNAGSGGLWELCEILCADGKKPAPQVETTFKSAL